MMLKKKEDNTIKEIEMDKLVKVQKVSRKVATVSVVFSTIVIVLAVALYYVNNNNSACATYKNKYETEVTENKKLTAEISDLQNQISQKNGEINTKNQVIEKIQNNYDTLSKQIDKLISALQS